MPRFASLLLPALSAAGLAGCLGAFADRYEQGNAALSTNEGAVYLVVLSPILLNALNGCIPQGMKGAAPVIVIVGDVDASGHAQDLDIEPDSAGTDCVIDTLAGRGLPKPPLKAGETRFPLGLKIETR
jgi:hypothetical protein